MFTSRTFKTLWPIFGNKETYGSIGNHPLYFGNQSYSKNVNKLRFHVFLHFHIVILPKVNRIHKKLGVLFQLSSGPLGPLFGTKFSSLEMKQDIISFLARQRRNLSLLAFFKENCLPRIQRFGFRGCNTEMFLQCVFFF